jgi:phosphopantothenoylcysteine decarboxylase/phosphopantothenate--cysteine ligase
VPGLRLVVTAGGTVEPVDPVRVITNRSTGKMGTAIAHAALRRGASVTLISSAGDPGLPGLRFVTMSTVESLRAAVLRACTDADVLIMAAAVSDFRPVATAAQKLKKTGNRLTIELEEVPDFLREVPPPVFKVGFAAETDDLLVNAAKKFGTHGVHVVCANPVNEPDAGFGTDTNRVTLLDRDGTTVPLPLLPKADVAERILDHVELRYRQWCAAQA